MTQTPAEIAAVEPQCADTILSELSNLQAWCCLMARKDSGGLPAADLIQRTRICIIEMKGQLNV